MNYTEYSGNWIVCGSYALVHAADMLCMDLIPLENSTGAPFGIRCCGKEYQYTRMLTVFRDFNLGIDAAAPLWGIQMKRVDGETNEVVADLLNDIYVDRVIIGPISMEGLTYLPLSQQYRCVDHFIACIRQGKNTWQLIDSEGVPGLLMDSGQIMKMLSIRDIPEACGRYTARAILDVDRHREIEDRSARISFTLETAYANLWDAQESGEGYRAIYKCAELIQDISYEKRIPLLYGTDYLIQRKIMLLKLLQEAEKENVASVDFHIMMEVGQFIETAGSLRNHLKNNKEGPWEYLFGRLAKIERCITEKWKEWIQYGSHS